MIDVDSAFARGRALDNGQPPVDVTADVASFWPRVEERLARPCSRGREAEVVPTVDILIENAVTRVQGQAATRRNEGAITAVPVGALSWSIHLMRMQATSLLRLATFIVRELERSVLMIFNARGASPLAAVVRRQLEAPYDSARREGAPTLCRFASRAGEAALLEWLAATETTPRLFPLSFFKISSRRFVDTPDAVACFGPRDAEAWRFRRSWSDKLDFTREYVPSGLLNVLLKRRLPLIFVDMPTRRSGLSTSSGVPQTEKELERYRAGARDSFKMATLMRAFGYRLFSAVAERPASMDVSSSASTGDPVLMLRRLGREGWCLMINPDALGLAPSWDDRPQLIDPWGASFSEFFHELSGMFQCFDPHSGCAVGAPRRIPIVEQLLSEAEP